MKKNALFYVFVKMIGHGLPINQKNKQSKRCAGKHHQKTGRKKKTSVIMILMLFRSVSRRRIGWCRRGAAFGVLGPACDAVEARESGEKVLKNIELENRTIGTHTTERRDGS